LAAENISHPTTDKHLHVAIVFVLFAVILFFSVDNWFGAVRLREFYTRCGIWLAAILIDLAIILATHWVGIPYSRVILTGFPFLLMVLVVIGYWGHTIGLLAGMLLVIGITLVLPFTLIIWLIIALSAWIKGYLRDFVAQPLMLRAMSIGSLIFASLYMLTVFAHSSQFQWLGNLEVGGYRYHLSKHDTHSSDEPIPSLILYECNSLNMLCNPVYQASIQDNANTFRLTSELNGNRNIIKLNEKIIYTQSFSSDRKN
jgi:hypothetical protein